MYQYIYILMVKNVVTRMISVETFIARGVGERSSHGGKIVTEAQKFETPVFSVLFGVLTYFLPLASSLQNLL